MAGAPVLSRSNGPVPCDVLLIGEAPGRLGAGKTGVPFSGDIAGRRLEAFLAAAGLRRESVFITNAALCLPLTPRGLNRPPTGREVTNCSAWLRETLDMVRPTLVVAMGTVALRATSLIDAHGLSLADSCGPPRAWRGVHLAVTYHPGARSLVHRPSSRQLADWQRLGDWLVETTAAERKLRP
jgi:uracil-DNA glycosylase family 4